MQVIHFKGLIFINKSDSFKSGHFCKVVPVWPDLTPSIRVKVTALCRIKEELYLPLHDERESGGLRYLAIVLLQDEPGVVRMKCLSVTPCWDFLGLNDWQEIQGYTLGMLEGLHLPASLCALEDSKEEKRLKLRNWMCQVLYLSFSYCNNMERWMVITII